MWGRDKLCLKVTDPSKPFSIAMRMKTNWNFLWSFFDELIYNFVLASESEDFNFVHFSNHKFLG